MRGRNIGCSMLVVAALFLVSACGDDGKSSAPSAVQIIDNAFSPGTLHVKAGTTVTWTWVGQNTHSVVGISDGFDYNSLDHTRAEGFVASYQFPNKGTFEYICGVHGGAMKGTVIVT